MSGIKYLRNGTDDQIFIMCKEIDWCVEVGEDVKSEEERQEVIDGLPTSVYFGKEWLKNNYCDLIKKVKVMWMNFIILLQMKYRMKQDG